MATYGGKDLSLLLQQEFDASEQKRIRDEMTNAFVGFIDEDIKRAATWHKMTSLEGYEEWGKEFLVIVKTVIKDIDKLNPTAEELYNIKKIKFHFLYEMYKCKLRLKYQIYM